MRIAVLAKQVPVVDDLRLDENGRLVRSGTPLEVSAYCRRAIAQGVALARQRNGTCTVITLGPPSAVEAVKEGVACGADLGVLVTDPAFAGSDTLATARTLARVLDRLGGFDLVLVGRNSVDADTGQVGPQLAALLGWPLVASARRLELTPDDVIRARTELEDGWAEIEVALPAVVSCAERLCAPAKAPVEARNRVSPDRLRTMAADELGAGPWGAQASPTRVGEVVIRASTRRQRMLTGPLQVQAAAAATAIAELWTGRDEAAPQAGARVPAPGSDRTGPPVAVLVEPNRARSARELLGQAALLAHQIGSFVVALDPEQLDVAALSSWGADEVLRIDGAELAEEVAGTVAPWCTRMQPWAILGPSTTWGREACGRISVALNAGLTGDALGFSVESSRLVCWKPAFGDRLVAAVSCTTPTQMATARPGVFPLLAEREPSEVPVTTVAGQRLDRIRVHSREQDDDPDALCSARVVIGVGHGVDPADYPLLEPLKTALGAELAGTRKVTDAGWLPHSRQIGLTGHNVAPELYVAIGIQGKLNHTIGVHQAGAILAINTDPDAPIFRCADVGIVADWRLVVADLTAQLRERAVTRAAG